AEAQAAFRGLQAKFPTQLGGRELLVHKADLGAKGTYYRAMVGPFANPGEAAELCSSLKAGGGQCLVQRN
ncbi:MAG: SPOR domain-containing protein, partial [Pseudolabrys sp.]